MDDCFGEGEEEHIFDHELFSDELFDAYLDGTDLEEFLTPSAENWNDVKCTEFRTKITIDEAKDIQWDRAKSEIKSILSRMKSILNIGDDGELRLDEIIMHIVGPQSAMGVILCEELGLSDEDYAKFLMSFCVQGAYKISSTQLFSSESLIKMDQLMTKGEYNAVWKLIATKKKIQDGAYIGSGRREQCLWELLEASANHVCRDISISNREGVIGIALDDDKIWVNLTGKNLTDTFGIKYTTHVKANRKGIIGHTAVSTGMNMPLGIVIQKKKDSTFSCFERLLKFLFDRNGMCDLANVEIDSDRGYMLPNTVFGFMIKNGANFIGTTIRSAQCWPFTFDQKLKENDKRTLIDSKGPPTLYVKTIKKNNKSIFATAFRNGTDSVSTAISSVHRNHHWEGVALDQTQARKYKEDETCLRKKCFQRVLNQELFGEEESEVDREMIDDILENKIDPITILQGK